MKAWVIPSESKLGLDNLELTEMPTPEPKANELLVEMKATAINPADYKLAEVGTDSWEYPHIMGLDLAGVVTQIGDQVTDFKVGDRVSAHIDLAKQGSFAEYAIAPTYAAAHIPDGVSFAEAAGLLSTGLTAYQAIHRKINLTNRQTALIHAGAGGVGSMAIQLAKLAGLTVYTTATPSATEFVKNLGADAVIDYTKTNFVDEIKRLTAGKGVDFILDSLNQAHVDQSIEALAFNGDVVSLIASPSLQGVNNLFLQGRGVHLVYVGAVHASGNPVQMEDLSRMTNELLTLVKEGKLRVPIAKTFEFEALPASLKSLASESPFGKYVVVNERS